MGFVESWARLTYHFSPICVVIFSITFMPMLMTLVIKAGYGKFTKASALTIPTWVGWIMMESPSLIFYSLNLYTYMSFENKQSSFTIEQILGSLAYLSHYVNRTLIFPFLSTNPSRPMELSVVFMGNFFCTINSMSLSYELFYGKEMALSLLPTKVQNFIVILGLGVRENTLYSNFMRCLGILVFLFGFLSNIYCDHLLRSLRKGSKPSNNYKIPKGYLFEYVSAANYFSEIVEWFGYFLMINTYTSLLFVISTMANLIPRGLDYHRFYLEKFENYPKNRKAIIPYVL